MKILNSSASNHVQYVQKKQKISSLLNVSKKNFLLNTRKHTKLENVNDKLSFYCKKKIGSLFIYGSRKIRSIQLLLIGGLIYTKDLAFIKLVLHAHKKLFEKHTFFFVL